MHKFVNWNSICLLQNSSIALWKFKPHAMSNKQHMHPAKGACYFLTFNTVDWVDIFIRPVYKQIIVHSLNHFIEHKGLTVYAWCLMTNHLHLLAQAEENGVIAEIEKEYKSFTTKKILEAIHTEPEVRRQWMLRRFEHIGNRLGFKKKFYVWQRPSNPLYIDLDKKDLLVERFDYIHTNPVRDRIVDTDCDYLYSSARDYSGMQGLVNITKLPIIDQQLIKSDTTSSFFGKFVRN
jgi:putative transposase